MPATKSAAEAMTETIKTRFENLERLCKQVLINGEDFPSAKFGISLRQSRIIAAQVRGNEI